MLSPHTSINATPSQEKYHSQEHIHLKQNSQQANLNQIFLYSDGAPGQLAHTKSLQAFGPRDTAEGADHKPSFDPFGSLGLDNVLSMAQTQLSGTRLPDSKTSFTPSSALDAADLQFSGYLLSGSCSSNSNVSGFSRNYNSCAPNSGYSSAQSDKSNANSEGNSAHLLGSLGIANTHPFGRQQQLGGGRYNLIASPTIGKAVGTPGSTNAASSEPSSYRADSHQSFSSANNMPLLGYSSYASLLNKANLMTLEERECCRRLVQFWRRHENNNIFCTFKAVAAADRVPNSIVVSCIYWEEKQDFFITSVDCIHLLESLIAVRFTVEEKNRIRRNLEGFRPLTVSKCKSESADFFKLIMSFPNPKPRNIEKDVKVFPWRILPLALKKIIGKYTASYSSTASIALDSYPKSRPTCYPRLAGMPISTSAGGMAAFTSLASTSGNMLGASSASAAVVAAAAAAAAASAEKSQHSAMMPATIPQSVAGASSLLAHTNTGPNAGFGLPLGMGATNGAKLRGAHMIPRSSIESSTSVPASDSSGQDYSSLLSCGDAKRNISRPATTPYTSNTDDGKYGYTGMKQEAAVKANEPVISSFLLSQGCSNQLDFAGMAADNPLPFLASDFAEQNASSTQLYSQNSILDQLAAGYGLSRSDCTLQFPESQGGIPTPPNANTTISQQQQQPLQRVARSSSTKRNTMQHTPYNTARPDRRKTANSRGSPSIPLILEQQQKHQQCVNPGASTLGSLANIETASASSSTMTFGESVSTSVDEALGYAGSDAVGGEHHIHDGPAYGALQKALLSSSGGSTGSGPNLVSGNHHHHHPTGSTDVAEGSDVSHVVAADTSAAFDIAAASTGAEMFNFGLNGDFSFLANLIAASGDSGVGGSLAIAPYSNGEIGLSPASSSSSNNTLAPDVPAAEVAGGDTHTADIFSLVHLPGGTAR
ncbi:hypothetical protein EV175_001416, partial [Coemansia sp. RSA 1933]